MKKIHNRFNIHARERRYEEMSCRPSKRACQLTPGKQCRTAGVAGYMHRHNTGKYHSMKEAKDWRYEVDYLLLYAIILFYRLIRACAPRKMHSIFPAQLRYAGFIISFKCPVLPRS